MAKHQGNKKTRRAFRYHAPPSTPYYCCTFEELLWPRRSCREAAGTACLFWPSPARCRREASRRLCSQSSRGCRSSAVFVYLFSVFTLGPIVCVAVAAAVRSCKERRGTEKEKRLMRGTRKKIEVLSNQNLGFERVNDRRIHKRPCLGPFPLLISTPSALPPTISLPHGVNTFVTRMYNKRSSKYKKHLSLEQIHDHCEI